MTTYPKSKTGLSRITLVKCQKINKTISKNNQKIEKILDENKTLQRNIYRVCHGLPEIPITKPRRSKGNNV